MKAINRIRLGRDTAGEAPRRRSTRWTPVTLAIVAIAGAVAGALITLDSGSEAVSGRRAGVRQAPPEPPATHPRQKAHEVEEGPRATAETGSFAPHADPQRRPAIVVESPRRGQTAYSPLRVSGRANVFEAWVGIEVFGASGRKLVSTFTTATCGTGCWGRFSKQAGFEVERDQDGTIRVFDDDADGDGRPQHEVRIPVQLKASISAVCPETTRRELDRLQAAVDRGHQPWRLDPVSVARQCLLTLGVEDPEMGAYQPTNQLRGQVTYRAGEQGIVFLRRLTPRSIFFVVETHSCCAA